MNAVIAETGNVLQLLHAAYCEMENEKVTMNPKIVISIPQMDAVYGACKIMALA